MTVDVKRSWLRHWHSVIDDAFGPDPTFNFEAAYADPYGDFRMHFMTWDLSDEALRRCFEVLPRGSAMCDRAIEMRSLLHVNKPTFSEAEAVQLFESGLDGYARFEQRCELKQPVQVVRGSSDELRLQMQFTDRVAVSIEHLDLSDRFEREDPRSFLRETLYRLAHSYDVVDYVEWPLCRDPQSVDPYRPFALLAIADGYYAMLGSDGPMLFVETNGVKN